MDQLEHQNQVINTVLDNLFKPRLSPLEKATANDDAFFESIGPDAWKDHNAVMNQIREAMSAEDDTEVGRILREHSEAYLKAVAGEA